MTSVARRRSPDDGQALVEFSIGILVFITLFVGMIDLARAVFMYNGVSQAARELARETSVYPGTGTLGSSAETQAVLATQRNLVPGLQAPTFECYDLAGVPQSDTCRPGDWVKVTTATRFQPSLPFLTAILTLDFTSSSSAEIQ